MKLTGILAAIRAATSIGFGIAFAPVLYLMVAGAILALLFGLAFLADLVSIYPQPHWHVLLNIANVATTFLAVVMLVLSRFAMQNTLDPDEANESDYMMSSYVGLGVFIGYYPVFLALRQYTGDLGHFFLSDVDFRGALLFGYDQMLKGFLFDLFEFAKIDLTGIDYQIGFNLETGLGLFCRVVAAPMALIAVALHVQRATKPPET